MSAGTSVPGAALTADAVGRRFGERVALRAVSLRVMAGEIVAIIGPNGAGKTTLLAILAGALEPTAGSVATGACPGAGSPRVGWVPQRPALYGKLSVAQNLLLFARLERIADPATAVDQMLDQTGLRGRASERVERLSVGNRQRVNIAVALLARPAVLLLDEPSAALDPRQRERLWRFVGSLTEQGTAVVFSTHDVGEAERYGDRVLVLADGEALFDGSPRALEAEIEGDAADFETAFVRYLSAHGH